MGLIFFACLVLTAQLFALFVGVHILVGGIKEGLQNVFHAPAVGLVEDGDKFIAAVPAHEILGRDRSSQRLLLGKPV